MLMLLALGCSENGFNDKLPTPNLGPEDDAGDTPGTDDDDGLQPDGNPDYADPNGDDGGVIPDYDITPDPDPSTPPTEVPPSHLPNDCDPEQIASFSSSEIWVGAHGNTIATGSITSSEAGWFHVYNTHIVESGASQSNESAYFRVSNPMNPDGLPANGNCGADYVVVDGDNNGPPSGNQTLVGTFWLEPGDNHLTMTHYCELYRDGMCPEHHIDDPVDSTCDTGNINSVHFMGFGLCLVAAD